MDLFVFKGIEFYEDGKFSVSIHQKDTHKFMYIPYRSFHQKHSIKNYVWGELMRYVRYNTEEKTLKNSKHSFSCVFATVGSKSTYFSSCSVKSHTHKGINYLTKKSCSLMIANLLHIRKQRRGCSGRENSFSPSRKGMRQLPFRKLYTWPLPAEFRTGTKASRISRRALISGQGLLPLKVGIRHAFTPHLAFHFKNICKNSLLIHIFYNLNLCSFRIQKIDAEDLFGPSRIYADVEEAHQLPQKTVFGKDCKKIFKVL